MIAYLIEVSICWLIFYIIYKLLLSKETFFSINRWYLLSTLSLGLVIPAFTIDLLSLFYQTPTGGVVYLSEGVSELEIAIGQSVAEAQKVEYSWLTLVMAGYVLGLLIFFARFLYGLHQIYQLYKTATIVKKRNYKLVLTKIPHLPFSFFNYMFWHESMEITTTDSQRIITHEVAHINQWHSIDVLFLEFLSVLLWFSPPIYWYKKSLRTVHEYLADAHVLRNTKKKQYGHLLIKQAQSGMQIALANNFIHSQLKQRIEMMTRNKSRRKALMLYLPALPILLLMVLVFSNKNVQNNLNQTIVKAGILADENKTLPVFPGGEKEMLRFIYSNIKYPLEARTKSIYGLVKVEFTVEADGSIRNLKLVKGVDGGISEEVFRVVQLMQNLPTKWTPGMIDGQPVAMTYELPVNYRLEGGDTTLSEVEDNPIKSLMIVVTGLNINHVEELPKTTGPILKVVDEMPRFSGCEGRRLSSEEVNECAQKAMLQFIYDNIKYPKQAKEQELEGTVVARFVVNKDGDITDPEIVRAIGGGTSEEVLAVIDKMPEWIPGRQGGEKVNVQYNLPIKFKLEAKSPVRGEMTEDFKDKVILSNGEIYTGEDKEVSKEQLTEMHIIRKQDVLSDEKTAAGDKIYKVVQNMPRFPGCGELGEYGEELRNCGNMKMLEYIYDNIKYPKTAREKGIEGTVVIRFLVEKDGSISDASIVRNVGEGTGEEALRVVNLMQKQNIKWVPGRQDGKFVNVNFNLPVKFKLTDEAKAEIANTNLENQKTIASNDLILKAFPNPAKDQVTIDFKGDKTPAELRLFDMSGKEIYREKINPTDGHFNKTISLSNVPKGTVIVKVIQNGKESQQKLIVQ